MSASPDVHPLLTRAVRTLEEAGLVRRLVPNASDPAPIDEVQLEAARQRWSVVRPMLARLGFAEMPDGRAREGLFVTYDPEGDRWLKLRLIPEHRSDGGANLRTGGRLLTRRRTAFNSVRGPSISVALMGPDGAGKSTLCQALGGSFIVPVRMFYAGLYPAGRRRYRLRGLGTIALVLRLWRMTLRSTYDRWRGRLVLFDRYAYDALLPLPVGASRMTRWRRALVARSCPTPDLVVVLDAPAAVLKSRRDERPIDVVEAQRRRYAELARALPDGVIVDASAEADTVRRQVTALIWRRYADRRIRIAG